MDTSLPIPICQGLCLFTRGYLPTSCGQAAARCVEALPPAPAELFGLHAREATVGNGVLLVLITGLTGKGPQLWMVYGKLYLEMDDNWGYPQFRIPQMVGNLRFCWFFICLFWKKLGE